MTDISVGQVWRDNDKRSLGGNRHCKIVAIVGEYAYMDSCSREGAPYHPGKHVTRTRLDRLPKFWTLAETPND